MSAPQHLKRTLCLLSTACLAFSIPQAGYAQTQTPPVQDAQTRLWLSYSVGSLHTQNASQFNQKNPGFGVEVPFKTQLADHTRWVAGRFKNSDNEMSNYLGVQVMPYGLNASGSVRAGAVLGAIDGYTRVRAGKVFPLVMPMVSFETPALGANFGGNLFVIPPVAGIPLTFALQLKVGF